MNDRPIEICCLMNASESELELSFIGANQLGRAIRWNCAIKKNSIYPI